MPDIAIFADTDAEPPGVYDNLTWLAGEIQNFPVVWTRRYVQDRGFVSLAYDVRNNLNQGGNIKGGGAIPVYSLSNQEFHIPTHTQFQGKRAGLSNRQCTSRYKIEAIESCARITFWGGKARLQRGKRHMRMLLGISADEWMRVKENRHACIDNAYPLLDAGITREGCRAWFERNYPARNLERSACYFCPFRSAAEWVRLAEDNPDLFEDACEIDANIRKAHITKDVVDSRYLHGRRIPLREAVEMDRAEGKDRRLPKARQMQYAFGDNRLNNEGDNWNNECEGHCGI